MSLVSHENIEIFVVIHEKAIQRSLKNEKETKSPEKSSYSNCRGKKTNLGSRSGSASKQKKLPTLPHPKDAGKPPPLVEGSLEDESDEALLASQLLGTERAGGVEGVRAVGQRDLTPEGRRLV